MDKIIKQLDVISSKEQEIEKNFHQLVQAIVEMPYCETEKQKLLALLQSDEIS